MTSRWSFRSKLKLVAKVAKRTKVLFEQRETKVGNDPFSDWDTGSVMEGEISFILHQIVISLPLPTQTTLLNATLEALQSSHRSHVSSPVHRFLYVWHLKSFRHTGCGYESKRLDRGQVWNGMAECVGKHAALRTNSESWLSVGRAVAWCSIVFCPRKCVNTEFNKC